MVSLLNSSHRPMGTIGCSFFPLKAPRNPFEKGKRAVNSRPLLKQFPFRNFGLLVGPLGYFNFYDFFEFGHLALSQASFSFI